MGSRDQGGEERRAARVLLTVLKAVALKIIQASITEPLSHYAAPQDGSSNGSQQVADEQKHQVHLHLLHALVAQGCGCQLHGQTRAAPSKVTGTLDFPGKREALEKAGVGTSREKQHHLPACDEGISPHLDSLLLQHGLLRSSHPDLPLPE